MSTLLRHPQVSLRLAALILGLSFSASTTWCAAPTNEVAATKADAFVIQPPFIAPAVPQSTFVQPKNKAEGRDPFFPKSDRPYGAENTSTNRAAPTPVVELFLKGISGTREQPLAIINTTTFAVGDELDVITKAGRMRIRCLEINMDDGTAVIQSGGERRQLRLPPLK
jgi:hypothetical protein